MELGQNFGKMGMLLKLLKPSLIICFLNATLLFFASYFKGNEASKRVMGKAGMTYSHTNKEELTYLGIKRDLIYYKIKKPNK